MDQAYAQCEQAGSPTASANSTATQINSTVSIFTTNMNTQITTDLSSLESNMASDMANADSDVRSSWGSFWSKFKTGLQQMTKQLNTAQVDQTRTIGSLIDAQSQSRVEREIHKQELESFRKYSPSEQVCVIDTLSTTLWEGIQIESAVQNAIEADLTRYYLNQTGGVSEKGPEFAHRQDWNDYTTKFCDYRDNGSAAGCGTTDLPDKDADISVSKTFFGFDSINLSDQDDRLAVNMLIRNLTGADVPGVIHSSALNGSLGQSIMLDRRSYQARMNAVISTFAGIVGERVMGRDATGGRNQVQEVQDLRTQLGVPVSETSARGGGSPRPSKYETKKAMVERVWDSRFYHDLGDAPHAIAQNEVQLQAYTVMQLNDLINKTEKIATLFAVQLATQMENIGVGSGVGSAPTN